VVATYIPGEVVAGGYGILVSAVVVLSASLSRTRERVARLEEWARIHEKGDR